MKKYTPKYVPLSETYVRVLDGFPLENINCTRDTKKHIKSFRPFESRSCTYGFVSIQTGIPKTAVRTLYSVYSEFLNSGGVVST